MSKTEIAEVKSVCESTINSLSSVIYNGVTSTARQEIENFSLENLFEELSKYPDDKVINEWLTTEKRLYTLKNLGVRKAINALFETDIKNHATVVGILEDYKNKLEVYPEVLLYEGFISALGGFNYLDSVDTELSAMKERVKKYKNDIDITKIIEVMKQTKSNYLLPLIEDVVNNYLSNKTETTKHCLKEALVKFSYDPFVRDIINIVTLDATELQLEYANAECGIEDKIYSPIIYLGENETLFNVKGTYYIKKGNNINKLTDTELVRLDPVFVSLCESINNPSVVVDKKDIKIYMGKDVAVINESGVTINDQLMDNKQFERAAEIARFAGNTEIFYLTESLRQNFDEIVEIDFVKRVYLKENENIAADVFKLRDNIFITTFDPTNNKTTFYRNINPIQAERVMMEHLRYDVSRTFKDILPNKDKILTQIDETQKEYFSYIQELEEKISQFSNSDDVTSKSVVEALTEELEEVKNDYKDYNNDIERYVRPLDEDLTVTIQDDQTNQTHTVTIPTDQLSGQGGQAAKGEGGIGGEPGTTPGEENITSDGSASQITFNDQDSELLSDEPGIPTDKVDMGADELEADAEEKEAEDKASGKDEEETDTEGGALEPGVGAETPSGVGAPEVGAEGAGDELNLGPEAGAEPEGDEETALKTPEDDEEEKKKKELNDSAETPNLERSAFDKDKLKDQKKKPTKKVFLKKKVATK
ncbi:MAG: hypothetical protein WC554_13380 [Clostridia bacterium]